MNKQYKISLLHVSGKKRMSDENRLIRRNLLEGCLLDHAATCMKSNCFENCMRTRIEFYHLRYCNFTNHGCQRCKTVLDKVRLHSSYCISKDCKIPFCNHIKNKK
jgi:hypothetical protein